MLKTAIQKAVEAGYQGWEMPKDNFYSLPKAKLVLLNPLFWQCLGKQQGWEENFYHLDYRILRDGVPDVFEAHKPEWHFHQHRFIDHITEGGTADGFFEVLIK